MGEPSDLDAWRARLEAEGLARDDVDPDPFVQFDAWMAVAVEAGVFQPEAMTVATVSADGVGLQPPRAVAGPRSGIVPLLHQLPQRQGPRPRRQPDGGPVLRLDGHRPPGAHHRSGGALRSRRVRRLLRPAPPRQPARGLGLAPELGAGRPGGARSGLRARSRPASPGSTCPVPPLGRVRRGGRRGGALAGARLAPARPPPLPPHSPTGGGSSAWRPEPPPGGPGSGRTSHLLADQGQVVEVVEVEDLQVHPLEPRPRRSRPGSRAPGRAYRWPRSGAGRRRGAARWRRPAGPARASSAPQHSTSATDHTRSSGSRSIASQAADTLAFCSREHVDRGEGQVELVGVAGGQPGRAGGPVATDDDGRPAGLAGLGQGRRPHHRVVLALEGVLRVGRRAPQAGDDLELLRAACRSACRSGGNGMP